MTDISVLCYLSGIFIACFSAFLILGKKKKQAADYILAAWFFVIALHLTFFVSFLSGTYNNFPHILGLEIPFPLMHGPILYFYTLCLTAQHPSKGSFLLHLAPAIIVYVLLFRFFLLSPQEKIYIYQHGGGTYRMLRQAIMIAIVLSGILYVMLSFLATRKYKKSIAEQDSNTEKINLDWLNYLIAGIAMIWVAVIVKNDVLIFTLVELFILTAEYFGISRAGILKIAEKAKSDGGKMSVEQAVKYEKNSKSEDIIHDVYERLEHLMVAEKLYKDPELTLSYVASSLQVHPNTLSQTINSMEEKNFYEYINRQRIDEFKQIAILPKNQKFTILTLAFESGFNSKTSFNRNFKKYANCSPREYLKSQNVYLH
ncbi:AraC family transcriptional regulator [Olivibacter sp. XZL3]|uniref:helix-turn-helix domain-containing protein n=1 Tax=Olivibacter sp. XZL3 TaxID=1735116 RepID=UPI001064A520|nr:helix-turn-helix domain-containing protein [Olivibacter sp. XZL3]